MPSIVSRFRLTPVAALLAGVTVLAGCGGPAPYSRTTTSESTTTTPPPMMPMQSTTSTSTQSNQRQ